MVIIVHAAENKDTITAKIGSIDYSYYFVLERYRQVLRRFGTVIEVRDPEREVDEIHDKCVSLGDPCYFLSFTPPFKTAVGLRCPTICVFAWEYATIPTDEWGGDARNDWRNVLAAHGCAITHSSFAADAVKKAMGASFPVWSIPAPVWNDFVKKNKNGKRRPCSDGFDLSFQGVLLDFRGCPDSGGTNGDKADFTETQSSPHEPLIVRLEGIIYTSVFNPNDGRKNWMDLLWAFVWAFREVESVTLVMKLAYHDYQAVRGMVINEIKKLGPFKCRVTAIHGFLNDQEYTKLVRETTFIVNTAHGEGQCLPLMEFMSAGVPAVAPAHSAMRDYISHDNAFVVKSSVEWIHWPHDPRVALRTLRYRINWESLYRAYLDSYQVALNDTGRYLRMSRCAVASMKHYCAKRVVLERLEAVFKARGVLRRGFVRRRLIALWRSARGSLGLLKGPS